MPTPLLLAWPTSILLEQLNLTTPLLALDLDRLGDRIRAVQDDYLRHDIAWHPTISLSPGSILTQILTDAGVTTFSLASLPPTAPAPGAPKRVNLLRPPVVAAGPLLVASASRDWEITVTCDHFAQAEHLATAARDNDRTVFINLRVDVGPARWGVSPGSELADLARGIMRLPGARLRGIHLPSRGGEFGRDSIRIGDGEYIRLAAASVESLRGAKHEPELIIVDTLETALLLADTAPGILRVSRAALPYDPAYIIAGVIARPLRDFAILDAGLNELGVAPSLMECRGWRIETIHPNVTTLRSHLGGDDLAIGDTLMIRPSLPANDPRDRPSLIKYHGKWSGTPFC